MLALLLTLAPEESQAHIPDRLPASATILADGDSARPTSAWVQLCARVPVECAVDTREPEFVKLTPQIWKKLNAVNRKVNRQIAPRSDSDHWGVGDRWDFGEDGFGDCEDYQLLKRKRLVAGGLPRRAMRMAVVIDEDGQGHAVMMVRTTKGDFILDNKRSAILPWHETGYVYVKREGSLGLEWVRFQGTTAHPSTTANQ